MKRVGDSTNCSFAVRACWEILSCNFFVSLRSVGEMHKIVSSTLLVLLVALASTASTSDQKAACHSTGFEANLSAGERFEHELGEGIWFSAFPDTGRWTLRIGPGREQADRFDIGWSLDFSWNENWELGSSHAGNAQTAMRASPRRLWFLVREADYRRLRAAQRQEMSSNTRVNYSKEFSKDVLKSIPKALAEVAILDYRLNGSKEDIVSATLSVKVVAPTTFPLRNAAPCECPKGFTKSKRAR